MAELAREIERQRTALVAIKRRASSELLKESSKADTRETLRAIHRLASEACDPAKAATR